MVGALVRRQPAGGTFHIEDVQDQVELSLMRSGEHEVARAYVLYREKRSAERARSKERVAPVAQAPGMMIVDDAGGLAGIFTDSDLARLFERRNDAALDGPIAAVMTSRPTTVVTGTRLRDALAVLEARRLSELPVVDASGRPIGILDIVDVVGLAPPAGTVVSAGSAAA